MQRQGSKTTTRKYDADEFRRYRDKFPLDGPPVIPFVNIMGEIQCSADVKLLNGFMNSRDKFFTRHHCILISGMTTIPMFNANEATDAIMSEGVGVEINRLQNGDTHSNRFMAVLSGSNIQETILPALCKSSISDLNNFINRLGWTYQLVNAMFIGGSGMQLQQGYHTDMNATTADAELESMGSFISFIAFTDDCRLCYRSRNGGNIEIVIPRGALCIAHGNFIHAGAAYDQGANQVRIHHQWLQQNVGVPSTDVFYPVDIHGE
jgi:hypothetical protein